MMSSRALRTASGLQRPPSLLRHTNKSFRLPRTAAVPNSAFASTSSWSQHKVSHIFTALIAVGVGTTAYGVYDFFQTFTMWPKEVRGDLRAGIKARNQGDLSMSERFLNRALETARKLPLEQLSPEPYLKLSGIVIVLAEVLEANNLPQRAYEVYVTALEELRNAKGLTGRERLRAVAIAHKLGEMAETYQQPTEEEEKWLVFAVEEMLRLLKDEKGLTNLSGSAVEDPVQKSVLEELELPAWVNLTDVISPLQSLGAFYNRLGKQEYSVPLFLAAINVLMPPGSKAPPENRCRGADMMNSLADTLLSSSPTPERREQAEAWVKKALNIVEATKASSGNDKASVEHCELVLAAALYNFGSLREMANDLDGARKAFADSRKQSSLINLREGVIQADTALRRVDRLSRGGLTSSNVTSEKK